MNKKAEATIRTVIQLAVKYNATHLSDYSKAQKNSGLELVHRLRKLEIQYNRLMKINDHLCKIELPKMDLDPDTGTITVVHKGHMTSYKFGRANPNIAPKQISSGGMGAYKITEQDSASNHNNTDALKQELEITLEPFYYNASKIVDNVRTITGAAKFNCHEITRVRNNLIEHPKPESPLSIGFSTNGPLVRPMDNRANDWIDAGLKLNTDVFIASLLTVLSA